MPDQKAAPHFVKSIDGRTVIGIAAVHGNVDEGGDRSHPGAFADIAINGRNRAKFLWQHGASDPPIASINFVREVPRDLLPDKVLQYAPEATGGVEISRTYLDTPRGSEVLTGIQAGAIDEMSYSYDLSRWSITEDEASGKSIREIYGVKIYDFSDVLWGMNPATSAVKRLPLADHSETVLAAVKEYTDRLKDLSELRAKEGRVLSGENRKRIENAVEALASASAALQDLLAATEPKPKTDTRALWLSCQRTLAALNGVPT